MLKHRLALLFAVLLCMLPYQSFGQANAVDAALNGYVQDGSKGAIPNAKAVLTNLDTGISQTTSTDANGYYRFPLVPVGKYSLTVTAAGFNTTTQQGVVLAVGQEGRVDLALAVGSTTETVNVEASATMADSGSSTVGSVLDAHEIENLPVASRNVYNVLLLAPGVVGVPTSTYSTTQFLFGGTERSQWAVDGLDDTQHGGNRQIRLVIITPEAVAETQTLANGYSAEFGRAAGGQVNAVLKSGSNQFHGSALWQYRPTPWQAIPTLSNPTNYQIQRNGRSWHDYAFTLGGPIIKDKLFFFGQFENNAYILPNTITIKPADAATLGIPASQIGSVPFGETYRSYVAKVNYTLNSKNSGYVRFMHFSNHQPNNDSGLAVADRGSRYIDHENSGGVQLATVISDNMLNEFRAGVSQRDTGNFPVAAAAGSGSALVNISGIANFGFSPLTTQTTTERESSVVDNFTWTRGKNTIKFGGEFDHELFDNLASTAPTFTFAGVAATTTPVARGAVAPLQQYLNTVSGTIDPATGNPFTYTNLTTFSGNPVIRIAFNFLNFFAQDEIRFSPSFSANVGARYEAILFPTFDADAPYALSRSVPNDYTNIAPRVALNWAPGAKRRTVVHAAYGMYYDVPGLSTFYNAGQVNGHRLLSYLVSGTTTGAPVFPNVPNFAGSTTFQVKPSITAFDPSFHNTYQHQANLQVQQELGHSMQVTVGYLFTAQRHGLYSTDINLTPTGSTLADGRPTFMGTAIRPNTSFGAINLIRSGSTTNFNGAFITLQKRMSSGLEFTANYTYSHALGDNIGEGTAVSDPTNIHRDYGHADGDVRHNLVLQGIAHTTFSERSLKWVNGFEFSSTTYLNSGFPINVTAGPDLNNDGILTDRPLFLARNSLRGRALRQEDAELKRNFNIHQFRISAFIISENLLNNNNMNCNTTTGCTSSVVSTANSTTSFLNQTAARTARNVQVGANLQF